MLEKNLSMLRIIRVYESAFSTFKFDVIYKLRISHKNLASKLWCSFSTHWISKILYQKKSMKCHYQFLNWLHIKMRVFFIFWIKLNTYILLKFIPMITSYLLWYGSRKNVNVICTSHYISIFLYSYEGEIWYCRICTKFDIE